MEAGGDFGYLVMFAVGFVVGKWLYPLIKAKFTGVK